MLTLRKMLKKRKGFTLIELIVVLAILAIIALLAIPRFAGTLSAAKLKTDTATARTIVSAVALYQAESAAAISPTVAQLVTAGYLDKTPTSAVAAATPFAITYQGAAGSAVDTVTGGGNTLYDATP
ncbi:MAG: prepilin-type N-terminal cleavage/methylation domain-containing protein [Eubacteriaceae bacterium]|nr:prepilin-type N-terminal cleavage/methylation domain-containing protein [Eubacteriaceae bacterium]